MAEWLREAVWSPYTVGIGIGLLAVLCFLLSDKVLACSTSFARTAGMIERLFRGDGVRHRPYYRRFSPEIDWQWMLVLGVLLGALASSLLSGTFRLQWVPAAWAGRFGPAVLPRQAVAFLGGVILGFGARWANGCTSGHGISGTMQNALSSWLAAVMFFAGGITTVMVMFRIAGG
jgi:uncharacterized membrane protein YedE/YeeE